MIEILFYFLLGIGFLLCLVVGFFSIIRWIAVKFFGYQTAEQQAASFSDQFGSSVPDIQQDIEAGRRLVRFLYSQGQIDVSDYQRINEFLDRQSISEQAVAFPELTAKQPELAIDRDGNAIDLSNQQSEVESVAAESVASPQPPAQAPASALPEKPPSPLPVPEPTPAIEEPVQPEIVTASLATDSGAETSSSPVESSRDDVGTPAPWDIPDTTPPAPRRSMGEILSGFMEARNMRWGELASGILIVLSAVGLVVSLRDQLSDRIPYFSSILFLLITVAIVGAGSYTLKKWKLRNTSRGTLLIGLLLIPINFLAACLLNGDPADRAPTGSPTFLAAVGIGLLVYGGLTYWAGQLLYRKRFLPLVVGVIGAGASTLLVNRALTPTTSLINIALLTIPLAASFLVATLLISPRQWDGRRLSGRIATRAHLLLAIAMFAVGVAMSLVIIRGPDALDSSLAMTPLATLMGVVVCWIGFGSTPPQLSSRSDNLTEHSNRIENQAKMPHMVGVSLQVLGAIIAVIAVVASMSYPLFFVITATLAGTLLTLLLIQQRNWTLVPLAWMVLVAAAVVGFCLFADRLPTQGWAEVEQWVRALVGAPVALFLMAASLLIALAGWTCERLNRNAAESESFRSSWSIGALAVVLLGGGLSLISSLMHRDQPFEVRVADGLLSISTLGCFAAAFWARSRKSSNAVLAGHLSAVIFAVSLAHVVLWDPQIRAAVERLIGIDSLPPESGSALQALPWILVATVWAVTLSIISWLALPQRKSESGSETDGFGPASRLSQLWLYWSVPVLAMVAFSALSLVPEVSGWASGLELTTSVGWLFVGATMFQLATMMPRGQAAETDSLSRTVEEQRVAWVPLTISTWLTSVVAASEWGLHREWFEGLSTSSHWLGLTLVTTAWAAITIGLRMLRLKSKRSRWAKSTALEEALLLVASLLLFVMLGDQVVRGIAHEIFGDQAWAQNALSGSFFSDFQRTMPVWPWVSIVALAVVWVASLFKQPVAWKSVTLIAIWMLGWAYAAIAFNGSAAAATGVRWLVPIGGLVLGMLVSQRRFLLPVWSKARAQLNLPGRSLLKSNVGQRQIDLLLSISAIMLLLVSFITTGQVLLNSPRALGGPLPSSWFKLLSVEVNFGVPMAIVVATFLWLAVSERRRILATSGSIVFQVVVVMALYFLIASPHEKLASRWFVGILQAVSIGMTAYGLVWYLCSDRIEGGTSPVRIGWLGGVTHLQLHTLINGVLVTGMAAVVVGKIFVRPDASVGWINSFGSLLGIFAWLVFVVLATLVWKSKWSDQQSQHRQTTWACLLGWTGVVLVAIIAARLDRSLSESINWEPYRLLTVGFLVVGAIQLTLTLGGKWLPKSISHWIVTRRPQSRSLEQGAVAASFVVALVGVAFAGQGLLSAPTWFWGYLIIMAVWSIVVFAGGLSVESSFVGFVALALAGLALVALGQRDPAGWFTRNHPDVINLSAVVAAVFAAVWSGSMVIRKGTAHWLPNVVMVVSIAWLVLASMGQCLVDGVDRSASVLDNGFGIAAVIAIIGFSLGHVVVNPRAHPRVVATLLITAMVVFLATSRLMRMLDQWQFDWLVVAVACWATAWAVVWATRQKWRFAFQYLSDDQRIGLASSFGRQVPVACVVVGVASMLFAGGLIFVQDQPVLRYSLAAVPWILAAGYGLWSVGRGRWWQHLTLVLITLGGVLISWAELRPPEMLAGPSLMIRTLVVLGAAMFIYGGLVSRWVRQGDTWLQSLQEMSSITCVLSVLCLVAVIWGEVVQFEPGVGCGISYPEAVGVTMVIVGMIVGLLILALLPQHDPFSLSMQGRQAYVYVAQLVAVALVAHLYLAMPWLFEFGLKKFWPFVVMVICFAGVGIAEVLKQRRLEVLAQPLFNVGTILPVLVAALSFIDSRGIVAYDPALVMMTIGLMYLMVCYLRQSVVSGAATVVFGNLALWLMLHKFPATAFLEHPQLWLIPPALSVLIGTWLIRDRLSEAQLTAIRYLCAATIYISSTSEIFIRGIGDSLWPPMLLAGLAVAGMMLGILLRIKSFLYLGSLFLLMAMLTMVSHAHQRFDHVWPWWAFGIGLGIAILVTFGLFEKRKNQLKQVATEFQQWQE